MEVRAEPGFTLGAIDNATQRIDIANNNQAKSFRHKFEETKRNHPEDEDWMIAFIVSKSTPTDSTKDATNQKKHELLRLKHNLEKAYEVYEKAHEEYEVALKAAADALNEEGA